MQMLVIDAMHCILEGLVHYHCHHVLGLSTQHAATSDPMVPVFAYSWMNYSLDIPAEYHVKHEKEIQHIYDIHKILPLPFGPSIDLLERNQISEPQLRTRLLSKNLQPLKFVCYTLNLPKMVSQSLHGSHIPAMKKDHFIQLLVDWVNLIFYFLYDIANLFTIATYHAPDWKREYS